MAKPTEQLRRDLLEPAARERGLSYDIEMLQPSKGDASRAFLLTSVGADLLLQHTDPDYFPSLDKRSRKRGAKQMAKHFRGRAALRASSFLAQAMGTYLGHLAPNARDQQQELIAQVQSAYPIEDADRAVLEECGTEFRIMETHRLPGDFSFGLAVTGYHRALADGEDPDQDPDLVEAQGMFAGRAFHLRAEQHAVAVTLGEDFGKVEEELEILGSGGYDGLTWAQLRMQTWKEQAAFWGNYSSPDPLSYAEVGEHLWA